MRTVNFYIMKLLKNKTTSKKVKFEAFNKLSAKKMTLINGGKTENPPVEDEGNTTDGL